MWENWKFEKRLEIWGKNWKFGIKKIGEKFGKVWKFGKKIWQFEKKIV